uniref:Putative secreted protein n=1 Tax=Amblyomma tuberculatum TaxID=48802 RepID=A0A6M2E109_9ACAR
MAARWCAAFSTPRCQRATTATCSPAAASTSALAPETWCACAEMASHSSTWTPPPRSPPSPSRSRRESFRTTTSRFCVFLPSYQAVSGRLGLAVEDRDDRL